MLDRKRARFLGYLGALAAETACWPDGEILNLNDETSHESCLFRQGKCLLDVVPYRLETSQRDDV